jgi:flavin-dependent dehydrogenase
MASEAIARQAVVIGAGIAGLAAARALSDHFEQVVVLERDSLSDGPVHRPGTPQSRHAHGLLVGGQRALSALFPGFEQDLVEAGAVLVGASIDVRFERPGYDPFPHVTLVW